MSVIHDPSESAAREEGPLFFCYFSGWIFIPSFFAAELRTWPTGFSGLRAKRAENDRPGSNSVSQSVAHA